MNLNSTLRTVADANHEEVLVASVKDTVLDAAQKMANRGIGALVVTDADRIAGILSERDIMTRVVAEQRDPGSTSVADVMTPEPQCVEASSTVGDAMRKVTEQRIRHLPLVTGEKLEGMVSSRDLLSWAVRAQETEISGLSVAMKRHKALIALLLGFTILIVVGILTT